jgi:hypothetical protein
MKTFLYTWICIYINIGKNCSIAKTLI